LATAGCSVHNLAAVDQCRTNNYCCDHGSWGYSVTVGCGNCHHLGSLRGYSCGNGAIQSSGRSRVKRYCWAERVVRSSSVGWGERASGKVICCHPPSDHLPLVFILQHFHMVRVSFPFCWPLLARPAACLSGPCHFGMALYHLSMVTPTKPVAAVITPSILSLGVVSTPNGQ